MMGFVEYFALLKEDIDIYFIVLLSIVLIAGVIDWLFGWINAKFNSKVEFVSEVALYGIIKKMMYFIVLILFSIVALSIVPYEIAIPSITTLFIGYIISEINSILSHLNMTEDGKRGDVFKNFLDRILKGDGK